MKKKMIAIGIIGILICSIPNITIASVCKKDTQAEQNNCSINNNNFLDIDKKNNKIRYDSLNDLDTKSDSNEEGLEYIYNDFTSIVMDSKGQPHIAYGIHKFLKYATRSESGWDVITIVDSCQVGRKWGYTHNPRCLALDKNDYPHIVYYENLDLKYVKWDGNEWVFETIKDTNKDHNFGHCSLALNSEDEPCIVFYDNDMNSLKYAYKEDQSQWKFDVIDTYKTDDLTDFCLVLDKNDNPHISYWIRNNWKNAIVNYATKDETGWHIKTVDTTYIGAWSQIALDSKGYPHICYWNVTDNCPYYLDYARWDGNKWQIETFHDGIDYHDYGIKPSISIDSKDNPCISFHLQSRGIGSGGLDSHRLLFLEWDGSKWEVTDVSQNEDGDVGEFGSLVFDSQDNPHISCVDLSPRILYFTRQNGIWTEEVVDNQPWAPSPKRPETPRGHCILLPNKEYTFSTSTTDPEGDKIHYKFYWSDGTDSGWLGPYESGETVTGTHKWIKRNEEIYDFVRVVAKDEYGHVSRLSEKWYIEILKTRSIRDIILLEIFGESLDQFPLIKQILSLFPVSSNLLNQQ